ncbi:hypothetical protein [Acidovorax sp. CCYZU-2555]|uniref:hypothetical protein n=1 Tax=Acidovorax sp. CCYZU-2555 TaxID=2835042 RepID=UPI0020C0577C|nr:hypothetical protein [Acidovorax sp. CCYZU-2555]
MSIPNSIPAQHQANNDLLIKGVTCAIIGLVVLVAPFFMQASDLSNLFRQGYIVGWFALALGAAFVIQGLVRRRKTMQAEAMLETKTTYTAERKKNKR